MKSYTDLEQSRKLAEILPIESADMCLNISQWHKNMPPLMTPYSRFKEFFSMETPYFLIPCWSLAALLSVLPRETRLLKSAKDDTYHCDCPKGNIDKWFDNPVDACVEMIVKLNEIKLL